MAVAAGALHRVLPADRRVPPGRLGRLRRQALSRRRRRASARPSVGFRHAVGPAIGVRGRARRTARGRRARRAGLGAAAASSVVRAAWPSCRSTSGWPSPSGSGCSTSPGRPRCSAPGGTTVFAGAAPVDAEVAVVMATSGTGGAPRLVELSRARRCRPRSPGRATALARAGHTVDAPLVSCLTPAHIGGLLVLLRGELADPPSRGHGARAVRRRSPRAGSPAGRVALARARDGAPARARRSRPRRGSVRCSSAAAASSPPIERGPRRSGATHRGDLRAHRVVRRCRVRRRAVRRHAGAAGARAAHRAARSDRHAGVPPRRRRHRRRLRRARLVAHGRRRHDRR